MSLVREADCQVCNWWITKNDKSVLFERQKSLLFLKPSENKAPLIFVNNKKEYQTIDGFGFALTGGSAQHLINMSHEERKKILTELFDIDKNNIGISYLRLSIGASDLNSFVFSYDDLSADEIDMDLKKFDLGQDKKDVIPVLKEILTINPTLKIMASPWSAPIWMKTNNKIQGGRLKEEYYAVYAAYLLKYIQEMRKAGIEIDAITTQNEPFNDGNTPSMQMFAKEQAKFIKDYLGPLFKANRIKTKIILYDHNCDAPEYPISILTDRNANKYIDGSAFHLYAGPITAMSKVHDSFPGKNLYFSEMMVTSRNGNFNITSPVERILIGAIRNWSKNVVLWNLAADSKFNPHTDNGGCSFCQGAITIDGDSVERNAAYYVIDHASKFIPLGSVRIESTFPEYLPNVAFKTPEGKIVMIVSNNSNKAEAFCINYNGKMLFHTLDGGTVATLIW